MDVVFRRGFQLPRRLAAGRLNRRVDPEWLDELPADDPRAVRSREDLRRMNRLMGHARIVASALRDHFRSDAPQIAELGAGDGTLLLRALRAARVAPGAGVVLVDRQPVVSAETCERYRRAGYRVSVDAADVFDWLARGTARFDAVIANLFLHHFEPPALARLLELASARTRVFVACEPRRAWLPFWGSHLLGLIGCNDVTRHDAVLSVRAGFAGRELSTSWPPGWHVLERPAGLFSHLFIAHR